MKKRIVLFIISLLLTFMLAKILNIYHFGDLPTILIIIYLIAIFSIILYILVLISFILNKILKKEKIKSTELIGRILILFILILVILYILVLNFDWLNWYAYSSPFYLNVIYRSIEFFIPIILLTFLSNYLLKK